MTIFTKSTVILLQPIVQDLQAIQVALQGRKQISTKRVVVLKDQGFGSDFKGIFLKENSSLVKDDMIF